MKQKKALLLIGGGYLQRPSIRWAHQVGLVTIVTDLDPNAAGRELANHFENVSGTDSAALVELAKRYSQVYQLVGAYCSNDFGLLSAATVNQLLGRPVCGPETVACALDKWLCKTVWQQESIETPRGFLVSDPQSREAALSQIPFPLIVKPRNGSGSRGVRTVWSPEDLESLDPSFLSSSFLMEQLVQGHHVDVNGFFVEDEFIPCGIMDRYFSPPPHHYPVWGCQPSCLDRKAQHAIYQLVEKAARSLGIQQGPVKADVVCTTEGPVVLELTPRFHGDVSTAFVTPMATGESPIRLWFSHLAHGDTVNDLIQPLVGRQCAGWISLFPKESGRLVRVDGLDTVRSLQGVRHVYISVQPGDQLSHGHQDNRTVCGFIWATGTTRKTLFDVLDAARRLVRFVTE